MFVFKQIVGKQGQDLFVPLKAFAGLQGQGEKVRFLPATSRQVRQHGDAAGVEVADAAQQVEAVALGQVLQAIDHQGQVESAGRQFVGQWARGRESHAAVRVREFECFQCREFAGADQQQARGGISVK
ncbi:hypothetical protein D9M73_202550 [compost metagenome]